MGLSPEEKRIDLIFILVFVTICNIILIIVLIAKCKKKESFYPVIGPSDNIPKLKWPFLNLINDKKEKVPIIVIRAYLDNPKHREQLIKYYEEGWKILGCSSNQSFPRCCDNPYGQYANCKNKHNQKIGGKDIEDYVIGWCHCMREPDKYIKKGTPLLLCSESDFNSLDLVKNSGSVNLKKKYDYIAVQKKYENGQCKNTWHSYYKNWPLCEKCIQILSDDMGLKGLIIGWEDCPINIKNKSRVDTTKMLKYYKFLEKLKQSKFLLLPNLEEASARIETEALACNVPIFVYENILGGWKYVNDETGLFFNENNIKKQAEIMMEKIKKNQFNPRDNYAKNYDINMGIILKNWLKTLYPELPNYEWVKFAISG